MTIENLGVKLYSGTKADRKSDSLGSAADGSNTAITQSISLNSSTNKVDFDAKRDGNNYAMSYDLGATISDTQWVARFPVTISTLTGNSGQNTLFMFFGLSSLDAKTGATSGSFDYIGTQLKKSSGASQWKAQAVDGGALNVEGTNFAHTLTTQTYYVEIKRTGATSATVELFSDSGYSSSIESESLTPASTIQNLRYIWIGNQDSSGGTTNKIVGTVGEIKVWNSTTTASGTATYTASPNSSTNWTSGSAKLGIGAYEFNGSSSVVTTDQRVNGLHDGTGGSITFWVKKNSHADNDIIYATHNASGSGAGIEVKFNSSGNIKSTTTNSSSGWVDTTSTTALANNTWYHVAVTLDTDIKYRIYINGTLETTGSAFTPRTGNSSQAYTIGDNPSSGGYFDGVLDDMSIWSRALTATEIETLSGAYRDVVSTYHSSSVYTTITTGWTGNEVLSGSSLIGKSINSVMYRFWQLGTGNSNTPVVRIYDSGGTQKGTDFTTTTTYSDIETSTSNTPTNITFTNSNTVTLAQGDTIRVYATNYGSASLKIVRKDSASSDVSTYGLQFNSSGTPTSTIIIPTILQDTGRGALVSSLSNKSNLKAYYSMDSTTITAITGSADWSEDFADSTSHTSDDTTVNGWYAVDADKTYYNGTNNRLQVHATSNVSHKAASFDLEQSGNGGLGTSINSTNWTLRFKFEVTSNSGSDSTNGNYFFAGITANAGNATNHIFSSQDGMGCVFYTNRSGTSDGVRVIAKNNAAMWSLDDDISSALTTGTYYIEIVRDSDKCTVTLRTGSHSGTTVGIASESDSSITGLRYFSVLPSYDSTGGGGTPTFEGYIDDIEFYDGVSASEGCKNDFSATSDLEGLTGVRTNSIFQQTDVPQYYWYNGTSWLLDGSPPVGGNLHAWYDASDSTTVTKDSSNLVSQLNDKSGNGYNLTASGTGTGGQPLWVSGGKNDLDIIDFASSKMMAAQWSATAQPMTFVAFVYSPAADGSQDNFWDNYDDTNSSMGFVNGDSSDSNNLIAFAPTGLNAGSSSNYTQKWGLYTVSYNTTSSTISINGDQKASGNIGTNPSYGLRLPRHRTSATYGQIKLAELLIYNKVLSSDELTKINDYFVNKWGAVLE